MAEQPRSVTTGTGGPFDFGTPFPWSLLKLDILEKYTNTLASIVGASLPICYVDLMAGEGYYASGDVGSAGRLAALAQRHAAAGRRVQVIAVEQNADAFRRLERNTRSVRDFIQVRNANWRDIVPQLLPELEGQFVFFFVDPMGIEEIPWGSLEPIVTRDRSEVLINFNSSVAARLAGIVIGGGNSPALEAVFAGFDWRPNIELAREKHQTHSHMGHAYMRMIGERGRYITCTVPIAKHGDRGQHKYHLVFASRNLKAFEVINDIVAIQREDVRKARIAANRLPLFPFDDPTYDRERTALLIRELADSLVADETLRGWEGTVEELRRKAFQDRFALYKLMLYADAVTLLVDNQQASVVGEVARRQNKLQLRVRVRF